MYGSNRTSHRFPGLRSAGDGSEYEGGPARAEEEVGLE